jgi:hypothetical protein
VDVGLVEHLLSNAELARTRLHERQRRLRAFLHDVAELARQDQLAGAGHARGFDEQNIAADRRPREARRYTRHAGAHRDFRIVFGRA